MNRFKFKQGRKPKYGAFIQLLADEEIYSAGSILRLGEHQGLLSDCTSESERLIARVQVRHALVAWARNHSFPKNGDGKVKMKGQRIVRGWTGARWKASYFRQIVPP